MSLDCAEEDLILCNYLHCKIVYRRGTPHNCNTVPGSTADQRRLFLCALKLTRLQSYREFCQNCSHCHAPDINLHECLKLYKSQGVNRYKMKQASIAIQKVSFCGHCQHCKANCHSTTLQACCLCEYATESPQALDLHIDIAHAEIFRFMIPESVVLATHQTEEADEEEPQPAKNKINNVLESDARENPHYLASEQLCQELLNNIHTITSQARISMKLGSSLKPSEHKANVAVSFQALCDIVSNISNYHKNSNSMFTKKLENLWFNVVTMSEGVREITDVAKAIRQDTQQLVAQTKKQKEDVQQPPKTHDQCCQTDTPATGEDVNVQTEEPTTTHERTQTNESGTQTDNEPQTDYVITLKRQCEVQQKTIRDLTSKHNLMVELHAKCQTSSSELEAQKVAYDKLTKAYKKTTTNLSLEVEKRKVLELKNTELEKDKVYLRDSLQTYQNFEKNINENTKILKISKLKRKLPLSDPTNAVLSKKVRNKRFS